MEITKEQLVKRLKSLAWGLANTMGFAGLMAGLNFLIDAVPTLGLGEFATVTIVLVINQITKQLNSK